MLLANPDVARHRRAARDIQGEFDFKPDGRARTVPRRSGAALVRTLVLRAAQGVAARWRIMERRLSDGTEGVRNVNYGAAIFPAHGH